MENQVSVIECGRYTFDHTWKFSRVNQTDISLWYVNSGWADVKIEGTKVRLKEGYLYFMPRLNNFEIFDYHNFDHTYHKFKCTKQFYGNSFVEIDTSKHGLKHLLEYGNEIITGAQSVRDFNSRAIVKYLETIVTHLEIYHDLPFVKNKYVLDAIEIINKEYGTISIEKIAQRLNVSISYFIRIFKKETGVTPMQHLQTQRLSAAKEMLKSGSSVFDTSAKCGYSSPTSFYYAYKQKFGYPPSDTSKL